MEEEKGPPEEGAVIVRRPKCACNTACPDTLQPVCASDGNTVSDGRRDEGGREGVSSQSGRATSRGIRMRQVPLERDTSTLP